MRFWLLALLLGGCLAAGAQESIEICYNYGCSAQADIVYSERQLAEIGQLLASADGAASERELLAQAVGRLYAWAGEQSPVKNDRRGNFLDDEVEGRMDCIDHSTSTTRLLEMIERRGFLRWHRVLERQRRVRVVLFQHFSAVVEELPGPRRPPVPRPAKADPPDYVPLMLALCDCAAVADDIRRPEPAGGDGAGKGAGNAAEGARFVVDSWFVDNGRPAVVMPLQAWLDGEGPNVE